MAKKDKKEIKNSKDKTSFMKSFKAEIKKVVWPTPKQLLNNTIAVLVIVVVIAIIVFVLDFSFEAINKYGIDKIKQQVSNSASNNEEANVIETDTTNEEGNTVNIENAEETNNTVE